MTPLKERIVQQSTALEEAAGTVVDLAKAVRKHWSLVVAILLLGGGIALLYAKIQRPVYEAVTMIEINSHATQPLFQKDQGILDIGATGYFDTRDYYETQYKLIVSDRVLSAAARDLALASDNEFLENKTPSATPPTLQQATNALKNRITVEPIKNSLLVFIKADDTDPKRAKRLSDAVAAAYINQNLETALSTTSDAVLWLNGQVDHIKQELEGDENALHDFKLRNDLPSTSINEASNMLRVEMQELDMALTHTRTRKAELAAKFAELSKVSSQNPDQLPASELLGSAFLQSLRVQYLDAVKERMTALAEGKGESHPLVRRADEKVTETRAALLSEIGNVQGAVERDLAVVTREEASDAALFEATRRRAVELNMKEIEYHRLDRTREENEKLYDMLLGHMKDADLARMMRGNNIRVVDAANEPHVPVRPRVALTLGIGLFVGLLLGVATAWTREQLDTSLKTPDDLEQKLGVTFLGLLPELRGDNGPRYARYGRRRRREAKANAGADGPIELIVHARPLSGIAEAARSVRTNLMFMNPDRPYRRLLVTSAAPSEGKTTVACSIAIALAQGGQRVCIVDCDLRRPRLHRIFGRRGETGVTNVVVGEATIDEVARPTEIDNLWSIPAGPIPPNPADMLHSERFRKFIHDLGDRFDRVIIDSPPIVAVTDSAILSTLVDGTVFVVRAFETSKHLAAQGLRSLRDVDAPIVGVVLNAVDLNRHEYSYHYHYYYYKRDGYRETPAAQADDLVSPPPN